MSIAFYMLALTLFPLLLSSPHPPHLPVCLLACLCVQLPVQVLAFAPSAAFALSAAEGERLVAVWATPSKASRKKGGATAAASLAVEQPVVGLSTVGESQTVVACFEACAVRGGGLVGVLVCPQHMQVITAVRMIALEETFCSLHLRGRSVISRCDHHIGHCLVHPRV
jgi:hypothetical protein